MNTKKKTLFVIMIICTTLLFASSINQVYITPSGKKYHKQNCRTLSKSKTITSLSIEEAKEKGYIPCKVCNP